MAQSFQSLKSASVTGDRLLSSCIAWHKLSHGHPAGDNSTVLRFRTAIESPKVINRLVSMIISVAALANQAAEAALAVELKNTKGVQASWVRDAISEHLVLAASAEPQGIKVTSDDFFASPNNRHKDFVLRPGDRLVNTDRHSSLVIEFLGFGGKSARFKYETKLDGRSFAKDQITIDSGEIAVELKSPVVSVPDSTADELLMKRIRMKLDASGYKQIFCKRESYGDEEFRSAYFSTEDSKVGSKSSVPRVSIMLKTYKTEADSKIALVRLSKLWKDGQTIRDEFFDEQIYLPVGAFVGKRAMYRKKTVLFFVWFVNPAERALLREACRESLLPF